MEEVSILAITKNGLEIASRLKRLFPRWQIYSPKKLKDDKTDAEWFTDAVSAKIKELFETSQGIVCLFSLGAVIRLVAPLLKDKKTDPAVIVIDDKARFVISALSGHLGGANRLTEEIAAKLDATAVITTAADVNKTIPVDLVGREFGWEIEDDSTVTRISAMMVNKEKIGIFQEAGEKDWWKGELPENVSSYSSIEELKRSDSKGYLIISDKLLDPAILENSVVYRPRSLVVGVGLHTDTTKSKIERGITSTLEKFKLSPKSVAKIASIKKPQKIKGLVEFGQEKGIPIELIERSELAAIATPNPSKVVQRFEGTTSVSEAAAIMASKGRLIVEKQKFPPDLTVAIARIER